MKNAFFWCLFVTYAVGVGGCLVVITQMVYIWDALVDGTPQSRDNWVFEISLSFSLVNFLIGGILFAMVADHYVKKRGVLRTKVLSVVFFVFSFVFYALGGTTIPDQPSSFLQIVVMLLLVSTGIAFGTFVNTFPTLVGEHYDVKHFGLYLGLLQVGVAATTFLVPMLCTFFSEQTGSYFGVFIIFAVLYMGSGVALLLISPPPTPTKRSSFHESL